MKEYSILILYTCSLAHLCSPISLDFGMSWTTKPEILTSDTIIGSTSLSLRYKPARNTGFTYQTRITYRRLDVSKVSILEEAKLFPFRHDTLSFAVDNEDNWTLWVDVLTMSAETYEFNNLLPVGTYQFKLRMESTLHGNSLWSDVAQFITTADPNKISNYQATIFTRGTGINNHNVAYVKIGDTIILNKNNFMGLYLCVLDRKTLAKVYSGEFNTFIKPDPTTKAIQFTERTVNSGDFTVTENVVTKEFTFPDTFEASVRLANKIKEYNEEYFIIIVSNVGWEMFFEESLADTLANSGASLIREFRNEYSNRFGEETSQLTCKRSEKPFSIGHPYSFVGIPRSGAGMGFESLRSNLGYYLKVGELPYAELVVRLVYHPFIGYYIFQTKQLIQQMRFLENIERTRESPIYSLWSNYFQIKDSNSTFKDNLGFVMYRNQNYKEPLLDYRNNTSRKTEYDRIINPRQRATARFDMLGEEYVSGIDPHLHAFTQFIENQAKMKWCQAPYNDYTNPSCFDKSGVIDTSAEGEVEQEFAYLPIALMCQVGVAPHICPQFDNQENSFSGYVL